MRRLLQLSLALIMLVLFNGCEEGIPFLFPSNLSFEVPEDRTLIRQEGRASFYREEGVLSGEWVEIARSGIRGGVIGGYLSTDEHRGSLILMLDGASTFWERGELDSALSWHEHDIAVYRDYGFRTWTLAIPECGVPYGQGDVSDLVDVIDWLDEEGRRLLDVDRVYVYGYSVGAITAAIANRYRAVTAMVVVGGLYEPDQLVESYGLFDTVTKLSPNNEALCQMRSTLDYYGRPDSPDWAELDTISHIQEFKSPMLFEHGVVDTMWSLTNTQHLEARYDDLVEAGIDLVKLEFLYIWGSHITPRIDPWTIEQTIAYFERFEP